MGMKQMTITLATLALCMFGAGQTAAAKDRADGGNSNSGDDGVQIIIRSESEKKRRQSEIDNSNRQSEPDSERGLDRAAERRSQHADENAQAGGNTDDGWYEYLFGRKQSTEQKSEGDWYQYLFGKRMPPDDKPEKKEQEKDGESNWWWPFD